MDGRGVSTKDVAGETGVTARRVGGRFWIRGFSLVSMGVGCKTVVAGGWTISPQSSSPSNVGILEAGSAPELVSRRVRPAQGSISMDEI